MKSILRCLALVAALCVGWVANAQSLETYTYSTGVDESMWITVTDSTNLLGTGNADARASSVQSIGFAFPFANSSFTQFSVNSDGNLRLGPTVTGTANYSTPFSSANSSINNPKINFLGCDGYYLDTIHYVFAQNTVDASNDSLLVVEFCLGTFTSSTRSQKFKWQVHMYPSGNIVVVFAPVAPNQAPATSNQKGICFNSGDGWIIASDNTATHFTSGSSTTWASGSWPSPNTYYAFTRPVITCPSPSAITLHNFGSTTANITFTPAGNETAWIGTITPGIMGFTETMLSDTNVNLMFLTPNTEYSVSVRAICGVGDTSFPTSLTFRTACSPTAIPYTENFDSVTTSTTAATGAMPSCWIIGAKDVSMTASQSPQVYYSTATSYSTSGSYSLRLFYRGYVALPLFDAPVDSLMLKFQVKQTASNYWLEVGVMDNPYDASTFVPIDTIHTANTVNHEYHEVMFNNYTGSGQYIAFHNILVPSSTTSYSYNYLDDIEVDRLPSCIPPNHVNVSNISTTGATISWVGNAANYTVVYGSDTNLLTSVDVSTNSVTLTSLTPATHYYVKVKAVCGVDDESEYSLFESFTTPCEALSVPYVIDFENVTTSTVSTTEEMPSCWAIGPADVTMTSTQAPQVYYGTSNAHGGSYSFRMYYRGYVVLPMFSTPVDSLMLKFWLKQSSASYQLEVGVMSDPTDASTFVPIDTIDNASTAYEYREVLFNNYTGSGQYIAFHNITTNTYNYSYNYIDDLQVTLLPTCFTPQNVAASNVDAHSATISWTGNASNYIVVCGDDTLNVTGNSITLAGLQAATTYSVSVKAVCSATDESDFSTPISFTTLCEAIALPYTEDFDNLSGNLPNCWTKIGAGTAAKYSSTTYAHSGNYSLRFNGATSNLVALPEMDAPTNTLTMSFWTRPESFTNSNCGTFSVGYVTDVTDANSFVALETYTYSDFTEIENKVVSFASAPATATIALRHTPNSTAWYWFVDDIEVSASTPECVATTWITGDSTGNSYYTPVNNYYKYTLSETIITAEEIGGPMRIDTISFHYMHTSPMTDKFDVTMWLQPTTKSVFSSTDDIDLLDSSIAVQIFSDSMNFSQGWNDIVLPTPYIFDGTTNLMLIVDDNSNDYNSNSYKFSTTSCDGYKTITWYSDGQNPDPVTGNNSLTGNAFSGSKARYQYRVRMALKGCDLATCRKPNDLAATNVTPYSVDLSWSNNNSSTTTYTIINLADSSVVNSGVSAGSITVNGLTPETNYTLGVYANCSADDSSIMATVTFATPATCVMPTDFACTGITLTSATLTWADNSNSNATYTIYDLSDTSVVATGITGTTYTVNGLTAETNYTFGLMADCSATDHSDMTTVSIFTGYCIPSPTSVDGSGITSVSFGGMTNTTHPTSAGYANYSSMSGSVPAGTAASVDITYATGYTYGTIIWVDWNNSLTFEGNEVVYAGESGGSNPTTLTATFDIPTTIATGNYRMRILGADSYFDSYTGSIAAAASANPCASYSWGVAEDYTLSVIAMPSCLPVTGLTAEATHNTVTLSWTDANNTGATYTVYDMSDNSVVATGITGTTYTVTGVASNSDYTFGVAANCSATDASYIVSVGVHTEMAPIMCGDDPASIFANADNATGTTSYVPAYSYYDYGYSEVIVPAERLTGLSEIKGMAFEVANYNSAGSYYNNCEIYLMHTTATSLTNGFIQDSVNFQLVYTGSLNYESTGWRNVTFDNSFMYNGTDNLLVAVRRNHGDYANGSSFASYTADSDLACYDYRDGTPYTIGEITTGTATNNVPVYRLIGCPDNTPECVAYTWTTGDSTGSSYYTPVNNYYNYSLTETIIEAEEIGGPMRIDTISFHYMYSTPMSEKYDVTIWLQPTTKTEFSGTSDIDLLDSSIAVQIFSDSMNFSYGWNDIVLPTPYYFDGTTNLLLIVDDNSHDYNSSSYKFSTADCSGYKTITWYSDSQNPDPVTGNNSVSGSAFSGSKTRYQYRVRMALKGCDLATCHKPNDLAASNVTPYSVNLSWSNNNSNNTTYTIVNLVDSTIVNTGVTAGSHVINGLTPETSYAFGVYANCSADDSSIMATVAFATPATCVIPTDFVCTNTTFTSVTLSWTDNSNSNASYTIYDLSDTSVVATGITGTTYTVNGLTAETSYTFGLMADCSATDHSDMVTVNVYTGYCVPTPTSMDGDGIISVSFGGMTNTTHPTSAGYANYSSMSGSVPAGTTATVDITYSTGYTYGTIIWVDWNSNMVFEGNEVVYVGTSSSSEPATLTATFDIPATQTVGSYRMRILGADSYFDSYTSSIAAAANANPCASYSWGVAEDYTLTVTTMPDCMPITGLTATANSYNSVTLSWTDANNTGATYTVYDMSDSSVVATGITGTTYTATGLTPNTYYTFGVAANCSATDASSVVTVAIHTPCVAVAVPFYESFDTNSATLGCWTAYSMNDANTVGLSIFNTNGIALRFSSYYSASDYNQYAYSPVFNYTGTESTLEFSVQYATYGSGDHLYFGYITPTDTVWTTNYYTTTGQSDVQTYTASIPANATQIAFHYYGDYAYYAWIDSVSVTEAPAAITMTISSADLTMGTTNPVPGTYTYLVGDTITVNAVPNTGYNFDYWVLSLGALTDTITLSTYTGVVPAIMAGASFSLVAHFAPAQFNVTLATADAAMGTTIPAPGTYSYYPGDTLTITAVPATNCHFVQWNDGDTNATRIITVTGNATYTAQFDYNPITVTLVNSDATMGTITPAPGIYTFHVGDTATAQATPATGYHFNQWMINMAGLTDSMPNNPVTMILPTYLAGASITVTATYAPNMYSIDVYANDNTLGTVTGTGQYAYNSYATITATPADHCIFVQWNDGDTNAVRNVLVTGNASYTATFQAIPQHEVTLTVVGPGYGTVTGAGLYYEGETVTITATPNEGYTFQGWGIEGFVGYDIISTDPTYTFTMGAADVEYFALFDVTLTPATLHIHHDSYAGTVFINDVETSVYEGHVGDAITLRAVANDGFRFVNWVGEGIEYPTSATITYVITAAETEIEANFEQLEGIIDVDGSIITIYSANNNIIVRGAEQQTIRVFDVVGRLVAQRSNANDEETIAMTNTGVYLVKVGDAPARRVVVRR